MVRKLVIAIIATVSLGVYAWGAVESPLLDEAAAARRDLLRRTLTENAPTSAAEAALAEAYWRRYPDVATDVRHFGRDSPLGILGAREHYQIHGRREGRAWGLE